MKRLFMGVILLAWSLVGLAAITTEISHSSIQLGEMFRMVLTLDNPHRGDIPDFGPLQKNFTIVGTEQRTAYNIINGETHSVYQWILLLMPKKTGRLDIPSIQIGTLESTAAKIEVLAIKAPTIDGEESPAEEVMLKTELSKGPVFINQQLIYTVKLYNSQRLLEAEFQPPQIDDALLIPLGDGRRYQTMINGHGYGVEEQQYAIFPQKSGDLRIKAPSFRALVLEAVPRQINIEAKSSQVKVKPIPADYAKGHWLAAKQVSLTEVYDKQTLKMNQGGTLVRTVTLQAAGVPAQLLPPLDFKNSATFNVYPEKPELKNTARQQELIGRADVKVTYILNKGGHITIPALEIPWFNTDTGKAEIVSLPERVMDIRPKKGVVKESVPALVDDIQKTQLKPVTTPLKPIPVVKSNRVIEQLVTALGCVCLLIFLWWFFRKRELSRRKMGRLVLKKLQKACVNNDAINAHALLLDWARWQWPDASLLNVYQVANLVQDKPLKAELLILTEALYSPVTNRPWRGKPLWRSISLYRRMRPRKKHKHKGLPPINPG